MSGEREIKREIVSQEERIKEKNKTGRRKDRLQRGVG